MSYVDGEGAMGLTGATKWSTCHTRGSSRPAVRSGLERFEREEDKEEKEMGGREEQGRRCKVVVVKI